MAQDPQGDKAKGKTVVPTIKFHDGHSIPQLGFGTYKLYGKQCESACEHALKIGYRHLDSAIMYNNEKEVGTAIKNSKIARKDIFVTTKLWDENHGKNKTIRAVNNSLKTLDLSYIDLFLIHSPIGGKNIETYQALCDLQKQGKIKSVGVSNFGIEHLKALENAKLPLPVVNQIELHPWLQQKEIVEYCKKKNIIIEAYSPLAKGQKLKKTKGNSEQDKRHNEQIDKLYVMGNKYDKTPAQILVRWSIQTGHVCLVKSGNNQRIEANFDVFNWNIDEQDFKVLNSFDCQFHCTWDPTTMDMGEF